MLFNSYVFIFLFLPISLIIFFFFGKLKLIRLAQIWLLICSLFFYGYWDSSYLFLMVGSIIFNHQMGRAINSTKQGSGWAKTLLWTGIIINFLGICYYKYTYFLLSTVNDLFKTNIPSNNLILPLAISFYTFTQIAYLVDTYRGETKHLNYDLITYSLFILFFPHLIAGPIVRHSELAPQLFKLKTYIFSQKNFAYGITLFSLGLSKKVLIADTISSWVTLAFNNADRLTFTEAWVGALSYTFQLYFDFSGYSDMAIGLGLMFNLQLPINFNSPYKAESISDFWRRWHITLSNFLRDYLYIPLGGNRKGVFRQYLNLLTTMLIGGLWHGAGWNYILWGGLHGVYLSINHWWRKLKQPLPSFLGWSLTFIAVIFSWVLFRAKNIHEGAEIIETMIGMKGIVLPGEPSGKLAILTNFGIELKRWKQLDYLPLFYGSKAMSILVLIGLTLWVKFLPNTQDLLAKFKPTWWWAVGVGFSASLCLLSLNRVSEFLYFQF